MAIEKPHLPSRRGAMSLLAGTVVSSAFAPALAAVPATSTLDLASGLRRVKAGALDVAYAEVGPRSGRPVVLLHGFPYDIHCYDEVAALLVGKGKRGYCQSNVAALSWADTITA